MRRDNDLITDWIAAQKSDGEYGAYHPKEAGTAGYIPKGSFFLDGIICEDKYNQAKRKVLYIAKECHTWEYDKANAEADDLEPQHFFVRDELNAGHSDNRFLKGLAMLQNAIQNNDYSNYNNRGVCETVRSFYPVPDRRDRPEYHRVLRRRRPRAGEGISSCGSVPRYQMRLPPKLFFRF